MHSILFNPILILF